MQAGAEGGESASTPHPIPRKPQREFHECEDRSAVPGARLFLQVSRAREGRNQGNKKVGAESVLVADE